MLSFGFRIFCWYSGFCHRTESVLLLFLSSVSKMRESSLIPTIANTAKRRLNISVIRYPGQEYNRAKSVSIRVIREMPPPTNVAELRRIIGMITYVGRFVSDLLTIMSPINSLLKSDLRLGTSHRWMHTRKSSDLSRTRQR